MKKYLSLIILVLFLHNSLAFASGRHHHNYVTLQGEGWNINVGNPPINYIPQPLFVQPQFGNYVVQPIQQNRALQLVKVCSPVYLVQTISGLAQQQQCWNEWR